MEKKKDYFHKPIFLFGLFSLECTFHVVKNVYILFIWLIY